MKKIFALTLALLMIFALAACSNDTGKTPSGSTGTNTFGTSQQGQTNTPDSSTPSGSVDVSTLNGFLAQFGLTEDDLKPTEGFKSFDYTVTDGKSYQGVVKVNMEWTDGANQKSVMSAWVHKVYDKSVAVSDDGKAYTPYTTDVYTLESGELTGGGLGTQWAWLYKGTSYWVTIGAEGSSFAYLQISFN